MTNTIVIIVILLIVGCCFLINRDNAFSRACSRDKYDPVKVSCFLGFGCLGIAASCIPSLLSDIFQNKWLNLLSIVLLALVLITAAIYEAKGKLK